MMAGVTQCCCSILYRNSMLNSDQSVTVPDSDQSVLLVPPADIKSIIMHTHHSEHVHPLAVMTSIIIYTHYSECRMVRPLPACIWLPTAAGCSEKGKQGGCYCAVQCHMGTHTTERLTARLAGGSQWLHSAAAAFADVGLHTHAHTYMQTCTAIEIGHLQDLGVLFCQWKLHAVVCVDDISRAPDPVVWQASTGYNAPGLLTLM